MRSSSQRLIDQSQMGVLSNDLLRYAAVDGDADVLAEEFENVRVMVAYRHSSPDVG